MKTFNTSEIRSPSGDNIKIYVAATNNQKQSGLSIFNLLKDNEGMLFLFNRLGEHSFWMDGMKFPIDIIWFNENKVTHIEENVRIETFPQSFSSEEDSLYVLELNIGKAKEFGFFIGQEYKIFDELKI